MKRLSIVITLGLLLLYDWPLLSQEPLSINELCTVMSTMTADSDLDFISLGTFLVEVREDVTDFDGDGEHTYSDVSLCYSNLLENALVNCGEVVDEESKTQTVVLMTELSDQFGLMESGLIAEADIVDIFFQSTNTGHTIAISSTYPDSHGNNLSR